MNLRYYGLFCDQLKDSSPDNSAFITKKLNAVNKDISDYVDGCRSYKK